MLAAALAQVAHVQGELAIAIDAVALQLGLREQPQQALIVLRSRAQGLRLPRVVTTGMHRRHLAQAAHTLLTRVRLDSPAFD